MKYHWFYKFDNISADTVVAAAIKDALTDLNLLLKNAEAYNGTSTMRVLEMELWHRFGLKNNELFICIAMDTLST